MRGPLHDLALMRFENPKLSSLLDAAHVQEDTSFSNNH
jgi:hypothetical protein